MIGSIWRGTRTTLKYTITWHNNFWSCDDVDDTVEMSASQPKAGVKSVPCLTMYSDLDYFIFPLYFELFLDVNGLFSTF